MPCFPNSVASLFSITCGRLDNECLALRMCTPEVARMSHLGMSFKILRWAGFSGLSGCARCTRWAFRRGVQRASWGCDGAGGNGLDPRPAVGAGSRSQRRLRDGFSREATSPATLTALPFQTCAGLFYLRDTNWSHSGEGPHLGNRFHGRVSGGFSSLTVDWKGPSLQPSVGAAVHCRHACIPGFYKKAGWANHRGQAVSSSPPRPLLQLLPPGSCLQFSPWLPLMLDSDL